MNEDKELENGTHVFSERLDHRFEGELAPKFSLRSAFKGTAYEREPPDGGEPSGPVYTSRTGYSSVAIRPSDHAAWPSVSTYKRRASLNGGFHRKAVDTALAPEQARIPSHPPLYSPNSLNNIVVGG